MADITVNVTSPGTLTTWGNNSWGSYSWGQITGLSTAQNRVTLTGDGQVNLSTNLLSSSVKSISFIISSNITVSSNVANVSIGNESAFGLTEVNVTTPGSPDLWGFSNWGNYAWGRIAGAAALTGSTSIDLGNEAYLSTNLLQVRTTAVSITGTATVNLNTNSLQVRTGNLSTIGTTTINLNNNNLYLTTDTNHVQVNGDGYADVYENRLFARTGTPSETITQDVFTTGNILNVRLGNEVETGDANISVTTTRVTASVKSVTVNANGQVIAQSELATITSGNPSITGTATVNLSTNLLRVSLGADTIVIDETLTVNSNLITSSVKSVSVQAGANVYITGLQMTAYTKTPVIIAWAVVNINVTSNWNVVDIAA